MLELTDLKKMHDRAFQANQTTRELASNDLVFYWVTQWDDQLLNDTPLSYRGQFDVLRKAGRKIMSDLRANPVQVDFQPVDERAHDNAEFLDGIYRADDRRNSSIEAYDFAGQDAVVCGYGAWELFSTYENNRIGDRNQVIRRRWIPEANNVAFWDPDSRLLDRSDAKFWTILEPYTPEGYKDFVGELTGERPEDISPSSFNQPEHSYTFPWLTEDQVYYVTRFYHKVEVTDVVYTMVDMFGQQVNYLKSKVFDTMDELIDQGYEIVAEKQIKRWEVTLYIASGAEILKSYRIPGEYIPVVPQYGERAIVESEEVWEGVTRLAKDPSRLRNFMFSYLADIVSRSPRPKPMFFQEQVQGLESMYEENGADNNYPYYLLNRTTGNGEALPTGPVSEMPDQKVPQGLNELIALTKDSVTDVADAGTPQNIADPDLSGKAVLALQAQIDKQSYTYQHNAKHAKRYDGTVYSSMAAEVYDAPRKVQVVMPDGTRKTVEVMQTMMDSTGEMVTLNDLTDSQFEVYSDIGPSYDTQKEQTRDIIREAIDIVPDGNPLKELLLMKYLKLVDSVEFDDVREYINNQLILTGFKEPETPEEEAILRQAQANKQPDAASVLALSEAKAREMEGNAAIQNEVNDANKISIDMYRAETERQKVNVQAAEAGISSQKTMSETKGKDIDNAMKEAELMANSLEGAKRALDSGSQMIIDMIPDDIMRQIAEEGA